MKIAMYIKNNRITIRDFKESDIDYKVMWINNPDNNKYLHYDLPLESEKTRSWFKARNTKNRADCVIEYDFIPVGLIGLLNIDYENEKAEFYISMGDTAYKRRGIASYATKMILQYAFEEMKLNKVYLNVDKDNVAARKLYEKTGFQCEGHFVKDMRHRGVFIDRMRYAVLKENFLNE